MSYELQIRLDALNNMSLASGSLIHEYLDFGSVGNIGATTGSYFEINNIGGFSSIAAKIDAPTSGSVIFEASYDGESWEPFTLRSLEDDIFVKTTSNHSHYIGSVSCARKIRFRTLTSGSAAGTVRGRLQRDQSTLEGQEFGWPPHRFGYTPIHKDVSVTSQQSGSVVWQPAAGKSYIVTDLTILVAGSTDGTLDLYDETDADGNRLFKGGIAVSTNNQYVYTHAFRTPFLSSAPNNALRLKTSAAMTASVIVHGYEI